MEKIKSISKKLFVDINSRIKDKSLIFIGEIHGTKEIPMILIDYFRIISEYYDFNICLELPPDTQKNINLYLDSGNGVYLNKLSFFSYKNNSDGRNSLEYLQLIKSIYSINKNRNKKISIFCFDVSLKENIKTQNEREEKMAENIFNKIFTNKKLFVITGNIHASKNNFKFRDTVICPVALLLYNKIGDSLFSINLTPVSGTFYNFGIKKVEKSTKTEPRELMNKSFNYVFEIEKVTPCSFR